MMHRENNVKTDIGSVLQAPSLLPQGALIKNHLTIF